MKTILSLIAIAAVGGLGYWLYITPAPQNPTQYMGSTNSGENPQPGSQVHGLEPEPAAAKARTDLAAKLKVEEGSIVIMKVEEKTWSDGCLGLGGPAESCLMALVDGFRVELQAKGKTYVYRTDATGASLRLEVI
jgi:hypothetical protein